MSVLCLFSFLLYLLGGEKSRSFKQLLILIFSLMLVQVLFRPSGEVLWQWKFIRITQEGIHYGVAASLRLMIIFLSAGFLLNISYYQYLLAFQAWKIPYELSFLLASVLQFLPILRQEFRNMGEALELRGIYLSKLPLNRRFYAYREMVLPILGRAIASLKYRVISLEMRAFRLYPTRTSLHVDRLRKRDYVIQVGLLALIVIGIKLS